MARSTIHRRTSYASRTGCDALLGLGRPTSRTDRAFASALAAAKTREAPAPASAPVVVPPPATARPVNLNRIANQHAIRQTALAELRARRAVAAGTDRQITIAEAAELLGLAHSTVTRLRFRRGNTAARLVKVGTGVSLASVEALLNTR